MSENIRSNEPPSTVNDHFLSVFLYGFGFLCLFGLARREDGFVMRIIRAPARDVRGIVGGAKQFLYVLVQHRVDKMRSDVGKRHQYEFP